MKGGGGVAAETYLALLFLKLNLLSLRNEEFYHALYFAVHEYEHLMGQIVMKEPLYSTRK